MLDPVTGCVSAKMKIVGCVSVMMMVITGCVSETLMMLTGCVSDVGCVSVTFAVC